MNRSRALKPAPLPPLSDATAAFLSLLNAAIHPNNKAVVPTDVDFQAVYRLAIEHRVEGLLLAPLLKLPVRPAQSLLNEWQARAMTIMMQQVAIVESLHCVLSSFEAANIRAVVQKGIVLKALYPEPDMRVMSDADLLVKLSDFARSISKLSGLSFVEIPDDSHEDTYVCMNDEGLRIELHNRLFDKKQQGFLSLLNEEELFPVSCAVRLPAFGGECWTFPPSEHALFQLLHMAKHMIVTGFGLRQVCDFCLFIEAYDLEINWPWFIEKCKELNLMPFARSILALCRDYLGLKSGMWRDMLIGQFDESGMARSLLHDILDAGVFGKSSAERTRSAAVVYRAFNRDFASDSRMLSIARAIFISSDELHPPYLYAKRHGFLLPVAWVHRLFRYIFYERRHNGESGAGLQVAKERIALLRRLNMLK